MIVTLIAAVDKNYAIGKDGKLAFHNSVDMQFFKYQTEGHVCIMGYNTFMSLPQKKLPNRTIIVITEKHANDILVTDTVKVATDIDSAMCAAWLIENDNATDSHAPHIFICGGFKVYNDAIKYNKYDLFPKPMTVNAVITHIDIESNGDMFFPYKALLEFFVKYDKSTDIVDKDGVKLSIQYYRKI